MVYKIKNKVNKLLLNKFVITISENIFFIPYEDIIFFQKQDNLTTQIHLKRGAIKCATKPLQYFINKLKTNPLFISCNDNYLLNLLHLKKYCKTNNSFLIMTNNNNIPIAKAQAKYFLKSISKIFHL